MTESVRHNWIYSMHKSASVHDAMCTLTQLQHITSEQHVELGQSRRECDTHGCKKTVHWFGDHKPFDLATPKIRSLTTGLTARNDDDINCDRAEEVGVEIQKILDNCCFTAASIKRKDHIRTLQNLQSGIMVGKKTVHIDPGILFMMCTAISHREGEDSVPSFRYEITAIPTAVFKDSFTRKPSKADLANELQRELSNVAGLTPQSDVYVVDGGWLLHRIRWKENNSYRDVFDQYSSYLSMKYGICCMVFDGYEGRSIKDIEHKRRTGRMSAEVTTIETAVTHKDQHAFFSNSKHKSGFIACLAARLRKDGHSVSVSDGDADKQIVLAAIDYARNGQLVAEDTDIFILMQCCTTGAKKGRCHHSQGRAFSTEKRHCIL